MVSKAQILTGLAKKGQLNALDYPIEIASTDQSYTDGVSLYIGQFKENTFDDIYPIIMHEYYHCRLKHFERVERAKTPLLQFLQNIAADIEINEYLLSRGITSTYFLENGQFKKTNSLNIEIPAKLHSFEEILAYLMAKLPEQKREALSTLSKQDFVSLGADLMGAPGEVQPNGLSGPEKDEEEEQTRNDWSNEDVQVVVANQFTDILEKEGGVSLDEVCESFSKLGIQREMDMTTAVVKPYTISWSRLLNKFTGKLKGRVLARTYQRPRRSGDFGRTVLPAFKNMAGTLEKLDIFIDVSGSMPTTAIKRFIETQRSLRQLSTETRISYYLFNTDIFPVKYHELKQQKLGGGTRFEKVYAEISKRHNPTIMFTDMETSEGDLSRLTEFADQLLVLTLNPDYRNREDLPFVHYVTV